ncbi:MAG TPA: transporter substrate-binding domain-containing protein [Thiothrix sp.]|nr:transporter substrate-binding domain-containing protein [Thiothrix sp.]
MIWSIFRLDNHAMKNYLLLLLAGYMLLMSMMAHAEETLKIGIKPSEPWVMYDTSKAAEEHEPIGFSIDLWRAIAKQLGVKTQWVYYDNTQDLITGTEKEEVDAGISAITVTAERQARIDFSDSMYELGLQIMVAPDKQASNPFSIMFHELNKLFTLGNFSLLLLMLFISANLRLWLDRLSKEPPIFPSGYACGLKEALWWGLTMLLTWETPHSRGFARVLDLSWHLIGLIILSILTAVVTSALTAQAVSGSIRSEADLPGKKVAAIATDAPRQWLEQNDIVVTPVKDIAEGIDAIRKGDVEALVHDGPRLHYLAHKINQQEGKQVLAVVPAIFHPQSYGIVFPEGSKLRESVNQALLRLRESQNKQESVHQALRKKWIK